MSKYANGQTSVIEIRNAEFLASLTSTSDTQAAKSKKKSKKKKRS